MLIIVDQQFTIFWAFHHLMNQIILSSVSAHSNKNFDLRLLHVLMSIIDINRDHPEY